MRSSSSSSAGEPGRRRAAAWRFAAAAALAALSLAGCESLQRKFTRTSKVPLAAPTPIVQFQDYTKAMTPLDRYRKHYLMFQYWNSELLDSLGRPPLHGKRSRHASKEALSELEELRGLLSEAAAARLEPVLAERRGIDQRLQGAAFQESQATAVWRQLDAQTRLIHREFFWRKMEDQLRPPAGGGG